MSLVLLLSALDPGVAEDEDLTSDEGQLDTACDSFLAYGPTGQHYRTSRERLSLLVVWAHFTKSGNRCKSRSMASSIACSLTCGPSGSINTPFAFQIFDLLARRYFASCSPNVSRFFLKRSSTVCVMFSLLGKLSQNRGSLQASDSRLVRKFAGISICGRMLIPDGNTIDWGLKLCFFALSLGQRTDFFTQAT